MGGEQHIKKAYDAILRHDFEQAIDYFERAVEEEPANASYRHTLSITYARSGRLMKALEHAEIACNLDETPIEYMFHLRNLRAMQLVKQAENLLDHEKGHETLTIPLLQEAIKLDPLSIEAHLLLGVVYKKLERTNEAVEATAVALKLDPQHEGAQKLWQQLQHN